MNANIIASFFINFKTAIYMYSVTCVVTISISPHCIVINKTCFLEISVVRL